MFNTRVFHWLLQQASTDVRQQDGVLGQRWLVLR